MAHLSLWMPVSFVIIYILILIVYFTYLSSKAPYNVGRKSEQVCEYEFRSENLESGVFMSPTYPGTYPNLLNCTYRFIGQPNERISIFFEEISTHFGADQ